MEKNNIRTCECTRHTVLFALTKNLLDIHETGRASCECTRHTVLFALTKNLLHIHETGCASRGSIVLGLGN